MISCFGVDKVGICRVRVVILRDIKIFMRANSLKVFIDFIFNKSNIIFILTSFQTDVHSSAI